jgi:putative transposase
MPRRPRLFLPHVPLHVTQRGVNCAAIFFDDQDRHHYRRLLGQACRPHGIALHAFVLMDNHVHLLLTAEEAAGLARTMRVAGQCYVQYFNQRHGRSGALCASTWRRSVRSATRGFRR